MPLFINTKCSLPFEYNKSIAANLQLRSVFLSDFSIKCKNLILQMRNYGQSISMPSNVPGYVWDAARDDFFDCARLIMWGSQVQIPTWTEFSIFINIETSRIFLYILKQISISVVVDAESLDPERNLLQQRSVQTSSNNPNIQTKCISGNPVVFFNGIHLRIQRTIRDRIKSRSLGTLHHLSQGDLRKSSFFSFCKSFQKERFEILASYVEEFVIGLRPWTGTSKHSRFLLLLSTFVLSYPFIKPKGTCIRHLFVFLFFKTLFRQIDYSKK